MGITSGTCGASGAHLQTHAHDMSVLAVAAPVTDSGAVFVGASAGVIMQSSGAISLTLVAALPGTGTGR